MSRMVFKALGLFGGSQVLTILCSVIRTKIIAVCLGTAGVGLFAIFNSALTLISGLSQLNLRTSSIRTVAAEERSARLSLTVTIVRRLGVWLGAAGVILMLLTAPVFSWRTFGSFGYVESFMFLSVAVYVMAVTMTEQAVLQGLRRYRPLAMTTVRGAIAGLITTVPLVLLFGEESVVWVIIAYSVAAWFFVWRERVTLPQVAPPPTVPEVWHLGKPILKMGFYLTLASATSELCSYIFIAWLNNTGGITEVGLFQSGFTLVNRYMGMIFSAIGMEFFPRLSSVAGSSRRISVFVGHEVLLLTVVMLGVVALFIPLAPIGVRVVYSSEFLGIVPFVLLSMPGVVVQGVSWCMAFVMLARGDGRLYMFTEVFSALLTISLNILFYHLWGLKGVGFSFTVYYLVYTAVVGWIYFRRYHLKVSPLAARTAGGIFILVICMSAVALIFGTAWSLILAIPSAVTAAVVVRRMYRR